MGIIYRCILSFIKIKCIRPANWCILHMWPTHGRWHSLSTTYSRQTRALSIQQTIFTLPQCLFIVFTLYIFPWTSCESRISTCRWWSVVLSCRHRREHSSWRQRRRPTWTHRYNWTVYFCHCPAPSNNNAPLDIAHWLHSVSGYKTWSVLAKDHMPTYP